LNSWRANAGVVALSENPTWSAGDYNHSLYMVKDDQVTHYETPGLPYYTVEGDTAARNGNIQVRSSTSWSDDQAIDWWMGAPFHALGMMDPRLTSSGFGAYREVKSGWQAGFTLDTIRGNSFSGGGYPVYWPGNNTTEPLTTYSGNEFPDPLQACPGYSGTVGLPVFIQVGGNVATAAGPVHSFTGNGASLAHCVIDSTNPSVGSNLTSRGAVVVIPQQPLVAGVRYVVALTVNGTPYTWSFTVGALVAANSTPIALAGDFNGDGKTDIAKFDPSTGQWMVGISTGTSFTFALWTTWNPGVTWVDLRIGDFNGDGKADIIGRALEYGQWWVALSTGTGFTNTLFTTWSTGVTWVDASVGDFNGDGKSDLVSRALQYGQWWVGTSTGTNFTTSLFTTWSTGVTWADVRVRDFNGDGKSDIVGRALQYGQWWVGLSTGTSFTNTLFTTWSTGVTWVDVNVGDFNGDGKADIVGRALQYGQWWVGLSTGMSFTNMLFTTWSTGVTWVDVNVRDFNGDGKADLVGRALEYGQWWMGLSTGTSFTTSLFTTWSTGVTWDNVRAGDFNGDGKTDIVGRVLQDGQWWVGLSTGATFTNTLWST
jgi:hypothetical protein